MAFIEARISEYFQELELPDTPTLYDHLVLSLRPKDLIATFNWDPFLFNACRRNYHKATLPKPIFLHGNVAIGYCETDRVVGMNGAICRKCGRLYTEPKLLYPVKEKNYNSDFLIHSEWETLQNRLRSAYVITVFGYSAPKTDVEAVSLLEEAWGKKESRTLEQIEIIDIRSEDELTASWQNFIYSHHYEITNNFYDSWIANHPRRTCEAMWNQLMEIQYLDNNPIPRELGFNELWNWYEPLFEAER